MPQDKRVETTALCGLLLQMVFVGIAYALYAKSGSPAVLAQMWFLAPGVLVWLMVLLHGRQRRLARQEREEMEALRKGRISEEIFEEQELDRMRAHTGLRVLERFVVPAFAVLLSGLLLFLAYWNISHAWKAEEGLAIQSPLAVVLGMAVTAFFGFLLGKYTVGLAHSPEMSILRASGSYLMGNVVGSLLLVLAMSTLHFGVLWPERAARYMMPGLMSLVAAEILLNLILDIYRPRVPGREHRPAYDSRLLGLFAEPGDVLKTVATTLNYQFGFQISETWFYRFMQRAIIPLVVVQLIALWCLSCVVAVERGDIAFIERFGRPRLSARDRQRGLKASLYGPGYHLKAPWPIEVARKVPADMIYSVEVGRILKTEGQDSEIVQPEGAPVTPDPDVLLWGELHVDPSSGQEADFLIPSLVEVREEIKAPALNIARVLAQVHFRIKRNAEGATDEAAAYDFYYRHASPERLVGDLGFRAMNRLAASQNFLQWIHVDRARVSERFARMLQEALDDERIKAGIEVVYAGIPCVHPPAHTAEAYEGVINAYEEKQTVMHQAAQQAIGAENQAKGRAAELVAEAESFGHQLKTLSEAESYRFAIQLSAFLKAPEVYRSRKYFSTIEDVLQGHRLLIVPQLKDEVLTIDTQEKLGTDILKIDLLKEGTQ